MKDLEVYSNSQKLLISTLILNNTNREKMCKDFSLLIEKSFEMDRTVDSLMKRLQNICKKNDTANLRITSLIEVINSDDVYVNIEDFKKHLKNKVTEMMKIIADKYEEKTMKGFQIKGNPVEDLSHQIKENELKIRRLQIENEKLSNILTKFHLIRTVP